MAQWYSQLSIDDQYLLAYVKPVWEVWIGTNYYNYQNSSDYVNLDPAGDPKMGIKAAVQAGYAAVCTQLKRCSGTPPS